MAKPRYFAFRQHSASDQEFIFELTDETKIAHAVRILAEEESEAVHVKGRIVKTKKPYNPQWDYHLDPATIEFFVTESEFSDANMQYVNDFLPEVGGPFLPRYQWCPWDSRLTREVTYPEPAKAKTGQP